MLAQLVVRVSLPRDTSPVRLLRSRARWYEHGCQDLEDLEGYWTSGDLFRDVAGDLTTALDLLAAAWVDAHRAPSEETRHADPLRLKAIRDRWEWFNWSTHGDAVKAEQAVKDIHFLLATLEERTRQHVEDETRWDTLEQLLTTEKLHSDLARLSGISSIVNSRKPLTAEEIARGQALAARHGWEATHPWHSGCNNCGGLDGAHHAGCGWVALLERKLVTLEAAEATLKAAQDRIVQEVAELPDRTSPDDWPEAMLVTADELRAILEAALTASPAAQPVTETPMHLDRGHDATIKQRQAAAAQGSDEQGDEGTHQDVSALPAPEQSASGAGSGGLHGQSVPALQTRVLAASPAAKEPK